LKAVIKISSFSNWRLLVVEFCWYMLCGLYWMYRI